MGGIGSGRGSGGVRLGAGRKPKVNTLDVNLSFRLTIDERFDLKRRAKLAGMSTSAFIKAMTLGDVEGVLKIFSKII